MKKTCSVVHEQAKPHLLSEGRGWLSAKHMDLLPYKYIAGSEYVCGVRSIYYSLRADSFRTRLANVG